MTWMQRLPLFLLVAVVAMAAVGDKPKPERPESSGDGKVARKTRVRLGGITIGAGYARVSGYPYYSPYLWRSSLWYPWDPFWWPYHPWYGAAFHPGYWNGFRYGPNLGEVRLQTESKTAEVFLDGAYAGQAKDRKSMWLEPGAYDLEVRDDSGRSYQKRIYVLSGKTLKLEADLEKTGEAKP